MTIFEKIIARQIPAKVIWEDEDAIAFHDVDPQAPVHVLIVPKKAVPRLADATDEDAALLGKLLLVARDMAKQLELSGGYRVVINCGPDAGESVPHLHVHLLGKRALAWPPGYSWNQLTGEPESLSGLPRFETSTHVQASSRFR